MKLDVLYGIHFLISSTQEQVGIKFVFNLDFFIRRVSILFLGFTCGNYVDITLAGFVIGKHIIGCVLKQGFKFRFTFFRKRLQSTDPYTPVR